MELLEVQKEADSAGRKAIFFGIGALVLAGLFGWMLARLGGGGSDSQAVVVAAEDIAPLTNLKAKHLRVVVWPLSSLPTGTFRTVDEVLKTNELTISGLVAGEPVLAARLSTPDRGLGVSNLVEPNMRAYVVSVNDAMAKSQIIHPGAFVDVVATIQDNRTRDLVSKVILQNVQVLAVGDSIDVEAMEKPDGPKNEERAQMERHRVVTLLVSLNDTEYLAFASQGKIDLALRSNVDSEIVATPGVNTDKVLGASRTGSAIEIKAPPSASADIHQVTRPHPPPRHPSGPAGPQIYKVHR